MIDPVSYAPAAESGQDQWSEADGVPLPSAARIARYEFEDDLPGGMYKLCFDVLDLWGAKPINPESRVNLVFMLSAVFVAGYDYAGLVQKRKGGGAG